MLNLVCLLSKLIGHASAVVLGALKAESVVLVGFVLGFLRLVVEVLFALSDVFFDHGNRSVFIK